MPEIIDFEQIGDAAEDHQVKEFQGVNISPEVFHRSLFECEFKKISYWPSLDAGVATISHDNKKKSSLKNDIFLMNIMTVHRIWRYYFDD